VPAESQAPRGATRNGERRQITALFYDLVGSTALLNRLDPEEYRFLQRRAHAEASSIIRKHGGYVDQLLGDGACAYFGYPTAAEDAAECAVQGALELAELVREPISEHTPPKRLPLRIGIATSIVVTGGLNPAHLSPESKIVGIAPYLAARAQGIADPCTIAVAEATYLLTRGAFDFEPLGTFALKGFDQPQRLWRPIAARSVPDRFSRFRRADTPLVSRENELESCRRYWRRAYEGQGQVILLVGEPGIGKSRLCAELRRELSDVDCDIRLFQCRPRGNTRPLHPFLDSLRREISGSADQRGGPTHSAVIDYIKVAAPQISAQTSEVIAFLLNEGIDAPTVHSEFGDLAIEDMRQRAVEAVLDLLWSWARARPQVIVLEDLHWADTLTMSLVSRFTADISSLPVLFAITSRDSAPDNLTRGAHLHSLALPRLDSSAIALLAGAVWGRVPVPAGLATFVANKSDGIPLFVEELIYFVRDHANAPDSSPPAWERLLQASAITSLQDLLAACLASLGESRRVAQMASVIGREFSYELLVRLSEGEEFAPALDAHLEILMRGGLIGQLGGGSNVAFRFRHVLMQEAASNSLLRSDRRELHDKIVQLVTDGRVTELPDEIMAWHCAQAGRAFEAARYSIKAAESCAVRSATHEAERLLTAAEDHLAQCKGFSADELRLQLLEIRGPVATALYGKGSREACAIYDRGVDICRLRPAQEREKWFPLYWGWWFTSPDRGTKRMRAQVIVNDLDAAVDPEIRLQALHCAWAANFHAGNHVECLNCIEQGLALYDPLRAISSRIKYGGHDAKVCALAERALSMWLTGDDKAATKSIEAAVRWAEDINHLGSLCHALDVAITLALYQRDVNKLAILSRRMQELAETHSLRDWEVKSRIFNGWAQALGNAPSQGLQELKQGLALQQAIGTDEDLPVYRDMLAEVLGRTGEFQAAVQVLDEAIADAERTGNLVWLPQLYRRRASMRQAAGGLPDQSQVDLGRSLSVARGQGAVTLANKAKVDLDRLAGGLPLLPGV
jgi:predicted ATPase/class 3 adenylate cyclase